MIVEKQCPKCGGLLDEFEHQSGMTWDDEGQIPIYTMEVYEFCESCDYEHKVREYATL